MFVIRVDTTMIVIGCNHKYFSSVHQINSEQLRNTFWFNGETLVKIYIPYGRSRRSRASTTRVNYHQYPVSKALSDNQKHNMYLSITEKLSDGFVLMWHYLSNSLVIQGIAE